MDISKMEIAQILRDSTHNLQITEENELDNEAYFERLKYFIEILEGRRNEAYLDGILDPSKPSQFISAKKFYALSEETQKQLRAECKEKTGKNPITTVAVGLNIESEEVRKMIDQLLGQPGLMDQVYWGKANLDDGQVDVILENSLMTRLPRLHEIYGSDWRRLRVNERISIFVLYFNGEKLVGSTTNFRRYVGNYVATNNWTDLKNAVEEVLYRSNPGGAIGPQNRRNAEATLLASYKCPTYTKPNESANAGKIPVAKINDTIVPLNNDSSSRGVNAKYFVWRTKMDPKVRQEHMRLEGKVFRRDDPPGFLPGAMHNCRCHDEAVPDYIKVDDAVIKRMAFELYMRKGIRLSIA